MLRLGMGDFNAQVAAEAVPVVAVLAVLGLAVGFVVLRTGLRLEFDPTEGADDRPAPAGPPKAAVIGSAAGVAGLLLLIVFQLGPWLVEVATGVQWPQTNFPGLAVLLSTWLIPLGAALVQVVVAAAAAFGIAVVRPLGRRSEWLLLVVAPWLLVGNGRLATAAGEPWRGAHAADHTRRGRAGQLDQHSRPVPVHDAVPHRPTGGCGRGRLGSRTRSSVPCGPPCRWRSWPSV